MLSSDERRLLTMIATADVPTWCIHEFEESSIWTFRHLHKMGLVDPVDNARWYTINERGRAELATPPDHWHELDYLRDAGERW